ncbi:MAG: hypothetical protein Q8O37_03675 [Sulfuricellaceae bacterium]|nr:hypothetical protein [Sulfuricellaceae bacterium]
MPSRLLFAVLAILPLSGCEMLTGDKGKDGESVGYACRVSSKLPEDCMKENATYTPTSILTGWKAAEAHLTGKKADGHADDAAPADDGTKPEGETKEGGEAKPEGEAPTGEAKPVPEENKH